MPVSTMQVADHILIPLLDDRAALAQVVQVQGSRAALYITDHPYGADTRTFGLSADKVVAVLATQLATLPQDHWRIIGYESIPDLNTVPLDLGKDDTVLHDPAVVEAFVNALHGLYPWDGFPEPDFFSNMLRNPADLPAHAIMTADLPKPD